MNLICQYPDANRQPGLVASDDFWIELMGPLLPGLQLELPQTDSGAGSPDSSCHSSGIAGSPLSSSSSSVPPRHDRASDLSLRSDGAQTLAPTEYDLFQHYLEHTSKDLTVNDDDQYTLQVGIPNLACESKPLMRSVLALAAVCKCRDIISQPSISHQDRGQVLELLSLAHGYHMESLREIQATLHETKHYEHVLANAAMMGMYGSGSYCTRIWLVKTATLGDQPLADVHTPKHSEWISLFRAARLAYAGLLDNDTPTTDDMSQSYPARSPVDPIQMQYGYKVSSRAELPRAPSQHPLSSILAATVGSALVRLNERAREIAVIVQGNNELNSDLQVCFTALSMFSNIATETFSSADDARPDTPGHVHSHSRLAFEVDMVNTVGHGRLSQIPPWLRRYTASITSMTPSNLPRRTVMSFIHKVPTGYLNLLEDMISLLHTDPSEEMVPEPSLAHQLALEIFAHWLVLVILLDNVWWIGGIGAWELGRIVAFRKRVGWDMCLEARDESWWPESMFEISRQFDKHRIE